MRLADFIDEHIGKILVEWEEFAALQLPAAARMTPLALRDHARQILEAVALDLRTEQSAFAQSEKSKGRAPRSVSAPETAAQTHALLRACSGFDINQMAAEYRALRASVLRLWAEECSPGGPNLDDLIRFNEAIDQALCESIEFFSAQVEQSRNLLLGMLGHDMRSPLQTILHTAHYLSKINADESVSAAAARLINSGGRMQALLEDLLDFGRARLGLGIAISPRDADMAALCQDELQLIRAVHEKRVIELAVSGDCSGRWDAQRVRQMLCNLVVNALKYGRPESAVKVVVTGRATEVQIDVCNATLELDASTLQQMFEPLFQGPNAEPPSRQDGSLGLGLYIAREIAKAHGGEITASSDGETTVLTILLPRIASGR